MSVVPMHDTYFLYRISLLTEQNPPGTMDRLREDLRAYFVESELDYGMGALGGGLHCYGDVRGKERSVTDKDRQALAEWFRGQRICAVAQLGAIESGETRLRPITEWVFPVDNLTDADRTEAAAYHVEMRRRVEALRAKRL
jgi:hypothetical protein